MIVLWFVCGISITESLNSNESEIFRWGHSIYDRRERDIWIVLILHMCLIFTYIIIELWLHIKIWYADSKMYGTFAVGMDKVIIKSEPKGAENANNRKLISLFLIYCVVLIHLLWLFIRSEQSLNTHTVTLLLRFGPNSFDHSFTVHSYASLFFLFPFQNVKFRRSFHLLSNWCNLNLMAIVTTCWAIIYIRNAMWNDWNRTEDVKITDLCELRST